MGGEGGESEGESRKKTFNYLPIRDFNSTVINRFNLKIKMSYNNTNNKKQKWKNYLHHGLFLLTPISVRKSSDALAVSSSA